MKQNLLQRIEALERKWSAAPRDRQTIAEKAFDCFRDQSEKEQFLSALGAERIGRPLTEKESAAKQKYLRALTEETGKAGYASIAGFEYAFNLRTLIASTWTYRLHPDDVPLGRSYYQSVAMGEEPTPEASAAVERGQAAFKQVADLAAGLKSAAELEQEDQRQ